MNKLYRRLALIVIGGAVVSSLAFAVPAQSGLEFCNKGNHGIAYVAIAYPAGKDLWKTEGWLNLDEGECGSLVQGTLVNRYYYYFAETNAEYAWKGDQKFCVSDRKFIFTNADKQCKGVDSRWEGFRELDTGKNATNYTLDLE